MSVLSKAIVKEVPLYQINGLVRQKDINIRSPQLTIDGGVCGAICGIDCGLICGFYCFPLSLSFAVVDSVGNLGLTKKDLADAKANIVKLRKEISEELQVAAKEIASAR